MQKPALTTPLPGAATVRRLPYLCKLTFFYNFVKSGSRVYCNIPCNMRLKGYQLMAYPVGSGAPRCGEIHS